MDNPRTAVIVAVIAILVGAAGLVFGISAKNSSNDAEDAASSAQSQLESQLKSDESSLGSDLSAEAKKASKANKGVQAQVSCAGRIGEEAADRGLEPLDCANAAVG